MYKNNKKRHATVQIDVDGIWVIYQHFGLDRYSAKDVMFESAFPRFLDIFDHYNIKATCFVVGRDLLVPARLNLLKEAVRRGHEIANHTMNHAEGFSYLSKEKKIQEIAESEALIKSTLGVTPKGFRTPSNDVDEETLHILEDRGYIYDSSLMPTYFGPLIKRIKFSRLPMKRQHNYLGKYKYGFAPLAPYHPSSSSLQKRGSMKLIEVPITTMPFVRIPFHTSFVFATAHFGLGTTLFDTGYALLKCTPLPLNFVFHTNELSDPISDETIKRQFGLSLPLKKKEMLCNHVLEKITRSCDCITSLEYAKAFDTSD